MTTATASPSRNVVTTVGRLTTIGVVLGLGLVGCAPSGGGGPSGATVTAGVDPSSATAPNPSTPTPTVASSTTESATRAEAEAPRLRATATNSNLFDANRAFRLELDHDGGPPVETTAIRLDSDLWEGLPAADRELELEPGSHVLVPLPYGSADCTGEADGGLGDVVVTTPAGEQRVPLDSYPEDMVSGRHARECNVAEARESVALEFGADWARESSRAATGTLVVDPQPGRQVELRQVAGNIVFRLTMTASLPRAVEDGPVEVPVRMSADRCDRHALIEAKRKYTHFVTVAVDGSEPAILEVEGTGEVLDLFQELLAACMEEPAESG